MGKWPGLALGSTIDAGGLGDELIWPSIPCAPTVIARAEQRWLPLVDHIKPHKGDLNLFWDQDNWQPLCKSCHDRDKQSEERRGYSLQLDDSGWPIDPKHPSNQ